MSGSFEHGVCALVIGVGATAVMDIGGIASKAIWRIPPPNYGLVGRWFAYIAKGRFRHDPIASLAPIHGEGVIGWASHYGTGVAFAGLLLSIWGLEWATHPTPGPALIVGVGTVVFPYFLMQPGMGAGFAASRTPNPTAARIRSFVNHGLFGLGLYVTGWMTRSVWSF